MKFDQQHIFGINDGMEVVKTAIPYLMVFLCPLPAFKILISRPQHLLKFIALGDTDRRES